MTETKEELKNEQISVNLQKKPNCLIEFSVTAFEPILKKAKDKAFKDVRKEVNIPGFRKGKAPQDMIEKKHPKAIEERSRSTIADIAFQEAVQLTKTFPLNQNSKINFNLDNFGENEATLTFSFETEPAIPDVDPKNFKLKKIEETKITKKEIDEAVKQMLLFYAKWTPVTDRGVQEKDYVIIDLETMEDEPKKVFQDTRFEVADDYMASWMKKLVMGQKEGAVLEGMSEPDKDAKEKMEPKRVKLTLKKVETAELPELNEEFAKKVGSESVEKLMEYIEKMLNDKAHEKVDREKKEQVNRFLLDEYPFELPLSLIESEKEHRKKQMMQDPKYKGRLEKMSAEEKTELDRDLSKQAEEAVRLFYISRDMVKRRDIQVTEQEVQQEALKTLQMFGPVNIDPAKIPNEVFALALSKVILAKAQNIVLGK